ncbi:MAG: NAD(P)-binding domain-containing protein [Candidatus Thiodiazotropha taylori]
MKIAFIGYGNMAKALSKRWASQYDLFIGGRNSERAAELAGEIQAAGSGTISEAVQFGEVIVIATPANAVEEAIQSGGGAQAFSGKVVIDINNPVNVPGGPHDNEGDYYLPRSFEEGSLAEHIAALIPNANIVKAFNMCQASVWEMDPPVFDGRKLTALYCGDDSTSKTTVAELIESIGCEPVDVGELRYARLLEASACIVIKFLFSGRDMHTVLNLIQPEVKPV